MSEPHRPKRTHRDKVHIWLGSRPRREDGEEHSARPRDDRIHTSVFADLFVDSALIPPGERCGSRRSSIGVIMDRINDAESVLNPHKLHLCIFDWPAGSLPARPPSSFGRPLGISASAVCSASKSTKGD